MSNPNAAPQVTTSAVANAADPSILESRMSDMTAQTLAATPMPIVPPSAPSVNAIRETPTSQPLAAMKIAAVSAHAHIPTTSPAKNSTA